MFKLMFLAILPSIILLVNAATANPSTQFSPPLKYKLEDVKVSVIYQTGHRLPGSYEISISGNGEASYLNDKKQTVTLTFQTELIMELLNDFYRIHFFELQDTYTAKKQVLLVDGNLVSTFIHRLVDIDSKRVCLVISDYKKCVVIVGDQPLEAHKLVKKIESLFLAVNIEQSIQ